MDTHIILREYRNSDKSFIYNSYLQSQRQNFNLNNTDYYNILHNRLDNFFKTDIIPIICADSIDDNVILGYILIKKLKDKCIILYAYTKHKFRNYGICSTMLNQIQQELKLPLITIEKTNIALNLIKKFDISFDPFILEQGESNDIN